MEDVPFWFWGQKVKGQGHNALLTEDGLCWIMLSVYTNHRETSHSDSPWVEDVPFWFRGQEVKGQGQNTWILENVFLAIIAFPLKLTSWNFTQRLSWFLKMFFAHNYFPFTANTMKLHTKTPLEFRMCPIYLGSKVKVTMYWFLKIVFCA